MPNTNEKINVNTQGTMSSSAKNDMNKLCNIVVHVVIVELSGLVMINIYTLKKLVIRHLW